MRTSIALAVFLSLASSAVQALTIDAKALARFDVGYARCEARFAHMKGHRDEAYLGLWRVKLDDKTRAQLTAARSTPAYQTEKRQFVRTSEKSASSGATSPLEQQCQALWSETQRATAAKP